MNEFGASGDAIRKVRTVGNFAEQFSIVGGLVDRDDGRARFYAEFLRQRSVGIAGHSIFLRS